MQTSSTKNSKIISKTHKKLQSLLGARKTEQNWTVAQGPKSSFQMKVHVAFHLEIKVPESGRRVERHLIHVA